MSDARAIVLFMENEPLRYRLGLDLGTNSLGWAMLEIDENNQPFKVIRLGVRIFDSGRKPTDGSSKAVDRRGARSMRRRLDRYLHRRNQYIKALVSFDLLPNEESARQKLTSLNPWRLRSEAIDKELEPFEIGRALFHLQQRRGFKSNRRVDNSVENELETTGLKGAINEFSIALAGKTVGQELWKRIQNGEPARARKVGSGQSERYAFYVDRSMVAAEFDAIWQKQASFKPDLLNENAREVLRDHLLYQRNLLPQTPGSCFFEQDQPRMPMAYESAQLFRLYQDINNLRVKDVDTLTTRPLTLDERNRAIDLVLSVKEMKLSSLRKKLLGKEFDKFQFTLETTNRPAIKGNQTHAILAKSDYFGDDWLKLSLSDRDEITRLVAFENNEHFIVDELISKFGRTKEQAKAVAQVRLPDAFLRIGQRAGQKILEQLINGWDEQSDCPLTYDKAAVAAGYRSHSLNTTGEIFSSLPYYGEVLFQYTAPMPRSKVPDEAKFGKIGNPTVHLGLNQVRKIVNALIKRYGVPTQIVVEVSRDLKNGVYTKSQIERDQKDNRERNEDAVKKLNELGQINTADNRLRLRLYDELGGIKKCVYSGRIISLSQLFSHEIQIDHILPMSRTLDNGFANKVLSHHSANKFKGNQSPFEAFGSSPSGYDWDEILDRAKSLPANKLRRFSPEATPEVEGFLDRQMSDTQYLARVTHQYLRALGGLDIWVTPGRLTGLLRGKWGLNDFLSNDGVKNRADHRHHAIDAAVIAVTDRSLLKRISTASAKAVSKDLGRDFEDFPDPWDTFRSELAEKVSRIVVSHKPEHGTEGALHNDTAYGIEKLAGPGSPSLVHHKVPITSIKESDLGYMKLPYEHMTILDLDSETLKAVGDCVLGSSKDKERQSELQKFSELTGRRSVVKREVLSVIPIFRRGDKKNPDAIPYKAYKGDGNYCYEIFEAENDKWDGRIISRFQANSNEYRAFANSKEFHHLSFNGEQLVMRLMANDCVVLGEDSTVYRVQKISSGVIVLAPVNEGNVDARSRDKDDPFNFIGKSPNSLKQSGARRVFIDVIGSVKDPVRKILE